MKRQALIELFRRNVEVFRHAWAERKKMEVPRLRAHEAEFLPAALALRDTPIHPAPRIAIWMLMAFALIAVLWATFGRIDVVATASGKIIPGDRIKLVQPLEAAVVRAIHVREGETVATGQVLVELDATNALADAGRLHDEALAARLEQGRANALLAALGSSEAPRLGAIEGAGAARLQDEQSQLVGQHQAYQARRNQLAAEIERRRAELEVTRELIVKLEQIAPIVRKRAEDYKKLVKDHFISEHGYLEREQARIELEQDLASGRAKMAEIRAALVEGEGQQRTLAAETRRTLLEQRSRAAQTATALEQELLKAESRSRLMRLTAPVSGTVQQLAVHTVGGVVTPAQPLMVIVPRDNVLEVEAWLANRDIGFVDAGQGAEVKVEAFPYTRYGSVPGTVVQISPDAIQDEIRGLGYLARVKLGRDTMRVENKFVRLSPGMAVTVEVKTGTRPVIEYFLGPLMQYRQESLRER